MILIVYVVFRNDRRIICVLYFVESGSHLILVMDVIKKKTDRHKVFRCKVCAKSIRSNNMTRHQRTHKDLLALSEEEAREELRARHEVAVGREQKRQKIEEIAQQEGVPLDLCTDVASSPTSSTLLSLGLEGEMLRDNQEYREKIVLGREVVAILKKGVISEDSLSKEKKDALDLYQKRKSRIRLKTAVLRPWQKQLMGLLRPSDRRVYWVVGSKGNEGKSWFQGALLSKYGYDRAVQLDICSKPSDIYYILSRRPLQTIDVFIFNDARSQDDVSYIALEQIKDGCASSTKYCSRMLNFRIPNIVIVFSNRRPDRGKLSEDRWLELFITSKGELKRKTFLLPSAVSRS